MTLVITGLVRDEVDVIAAWIEHHLAQGVAHVIVTDNGSIDGTCDVLGAYEAAGRIVLWHEAGDDYRQSEWVSKMARFAATDLGAAWVINADADEFWRTREPGTTLAEFFARLPESTAGVRAIRHDLRGGTSERGGWIRRLKWLDRRTVSERGTPRGPKLAHRAGPEVIVAQGNHSVEGVSGDIDESHGIEIVHVPMRSWAQFSHKIDVGGAALARNSDLPSESGWHWRADHRRLQEGTLDAAYRERCLSRTERVADPGRFSRERRLARELKALVRGAVLPDQLKASLRS